MPVYLLQKIQGPSKGWVWVTSSITPYAGCGDNHSGRAIRNTNPHNTECSKGGETDEMGWERTRSHNGGQQQDGQGPAVLIGAVNLGCGRKGHSHGVPQGACMRTGFHRLRCPRPDGLATVTVGTHTLLLPWEMQRSWNILQ